MAFFEGAVSYADIKRMPIPELLILQAQANEIHTEREAELARARRGK